MIVLQRNLENYENQTLLLEEAISDLTENKKELKKRYEELSGWHLTCETNFTDVSGKWRECEFVKGGIEATLRTCEQTVKDKDGSQAELLKALSGRQAELDECNATNVRLVTEHRRRLGEMSEDFRLVGEAKKCLQQCGQLEWVGEKYMCVRVVVMGNFCSITPNEESVLSGVEECHMLSDATLWTLDWGHFLRKNPVTGCVLVGLFVFALNGLVLSLVWICVCAKWRMEGRRMKQILWKPQPAVGGDSIENPSFRSDLAVDKKKSEVKPVFKKDPPIIKRSDPAEKKGSISVKRPVISAPILLKRSPEVGVNGEPLGARPKEPRISSSKAVLETQGKRKRLILV
jgi:hypothetical protein